MIVADERAHDALTKTPARLNREEEVKVQCEGLDQRARACGGIIGQTQRSGGH